MKLTKTSPDQITADSQRTNTEKINKSIETARAKQRELESLYAGAIAIATDYKLQKRMNAAREAGPQVGIPPELTVRDPLSVQAQQNIAPRVAYPPEPAGLDSHQFGY